MHLIDLHSKVLLAQISLINDCKGMTAFFLSHATIAYDKKKTEPHIVSHHFSLA